MNLRWIRRQGRQRWNQESGYCRRALAETQITRKRVPGQKRILGASLLGRAEKNQAVECRLRCAVLNRLTQQGMPESYPILA